MVEHLAQRPGLGAENPPEGSARSTDDEPKATVEVERPLAGQTVTVSVEPGLRIVIDFNPANAGYEVEGDDFVLTLEDGGRVVLQGLVSGSQSASVPTMQVAGINIGADVLIEQVLDLTSEPDVIETAAGEEGEEAALVEGGGRQYGDSFGDLIAGLIKQGIIGEVDLGFDPIGSGGTSVLVDAEFLSEGFLLSGGGFSFMTFGPTSLVSPVGTTPGFALGGPGTVPGVAPLSAESGPVHDSPVVAPLAPLIVNDMTIITNEATGNLQIPDELILYFANASQGQGLSISGPSYDGVTDNAHIWASGGGAPGNPNTWADDGNGNLKFHIGGGLPFYEGSLAYEVSDQQGATGQGTINVENFATGKVGAHWTLTGTGADEVLLGLDGRNQIDGGGGNDTLHGGHDSSADILNGDAGDDLIFSGGGGDTIDGGAGSGDTIIYIGSSAAVSVDLGAGTASGGDAAGDTITNVENLIGSDFNDTLTGDAGANTLTGGAGGDTIDGGAGSGDTMIDMGSGAAVGGDRGAGTGSGGDAAGDTITNVENLVGSGFDDTLTGDAGANTLTGGAGSDTLDGGGGNDILLFDSLDAAVDGGIGTDTLRVEGGDADLTAFGGTMLGIEQIDLQTDTGANAVTLVAQDVIDISDTDTLTIDGDAGDSVNAGTGWTDGGIAGGYHVYTQGGATLNVDIDITVNLDIV